MIRHLLIVFVVACAVRAPFAMRSYDVVDARGYKQYAVNVLEHGVYGWSQSPPIEPSAYRAPVYPMFLASLYGLLGYDDTPVLWVQVLLSALAAVSVYFVAREIWESKRLAFWASLVCAIHPFPGHLVGTVMSDTLFTFLLSIAVLCFVRAIRTVSWTWNMIGGVMLGLATLCRPVVQIYWVFMLFGLVIHFRGVGKRAVSLGLALLLGLAIVVAPWTVRNAWALGQFVPISAGATPTMLYLTTLDPSVYHPVHRPDLNEVAKSNPIIKEYLKGIHTHDDALINSSEKEMMRETWPAIIGDPVGYLWEQAKLHPYMWIGSSYLYRTFPFPETWSLQKKGLFKVATCALLHALPLLCFVLYAWFERRAWRRWWPVFLVPVYTSLVFFPLYIEMRYSLPVIQYVLMFSVALYFRVRGRGVDASSPWRQTA